MKISEALTITDPHVVKEEDGEGFSVTINGVEYRYFSNDLTAEEIQNKYKGVARHSIGAALQWLKKNTFLYWDSKKGQRGHVVEEGAIYQFKNGKVVVMGVSEGRVRYKDKWGKSFEASVEKFMGRNPVRLDEGDEDGVYGDALDTGGEAPDDFVDYGDLGTPEPDPGVEGDGMEIYVGQTLTLNKGTEDEVVGKVSSVDEENKTVVISAGDVLITITFGELSEVGSPEEPVEGEVVSEEEMGDWPEGDEE